VGPPKAKGICGERLLTLATSANPQPVGSLWCDTRGEVPDFYMSQIMLMHALQGKSAQSTDLELSGQGGATVMVMVMIRLLSTLAGPQFPHL
jgi:hypothetical protein